MVLATFVSPIHASSPIFTLVPLPLLVVNNWSTVKSPDFVCAVPPVLRKYELSAPSNVSALFAYEAVVAVAAFPVVSWFQVGTVPSTDRLPLIFKEPVKSWLSSKVSPNLVEPDSCIIEADTNSVWNSCAVKVPATVTSPAKVASPLAVSSPTDILFVVVAPLPVTESRVSVSEYEDKNGPVSA